MDIDGVFVCLCVHQEMMNTIQKNGINKRVEYAVASLVNYLQAYTSIPPLKKSCKAHTYILCIQ